MGRYCLCATEVTNKELSDWGTTAEQQSTPIRGIYRLALAHYNLKQYDEARQQIERLQHLFKHQPEMQSLYTKIIVGCNAANSNYKNMVKKMFN